MSTYLELCGDLARAVGYEAPTSVVAQTGSALKLVNRIAQAELEIKNLWQDWRFLSSENNTPYSQTLTIDQIGYTKPADHGVWDPKSFYIDYTTDNYRHLDPLDYDEWRKTFRNGTQTSDIPTRVVLDRNDDIILWPPPDSGYTLTGEYMILPIRMTANAEVSVIPVQFHRVILLKAKLFYAEEEDGPEIFEASSAELYGTRDMPGGLLGQLESHQLPDQGNRRKARGEDLTVVAQ